MATRRTKVSEPSEPLPKRRRATTPEARENQLIAMAVDLTERQIREGTVSSQVLTHYIKLGSSREKLEQERIAGENRLNAAKIELMESQKRSEALFAEALRAMRSYAGQDPGQDPDLDD